MMGASRYIVVLGGATVRYTSLSDRRPVLLQGAWRRYAAQPDTRNYADRVHRNRRYTARYQMQKCYFYKTTVASEVARLQAQESSSTVKLDRAADIWLVGTTHSNEYSTH